MTAKTTKPLAGGFIVDVDIRRALRPCLVYENKQGGIYTFPSIGANLPAFPVESSTLQAGVMSEGHTSFRLRVESPRSLKGRIGVKATAGSGQHGLLTPKLNRGLGGALLRLHPTASQ